MTTVTIGPQFVVNGPLPIPPRYSLLNVATVVDETDPHWMAGLAVWPFPSLDSSDVHAPCLPGTSPAAEKIEGGAIPLPIWGAYTAYVAETCTARGIWDQADYQNRAVIAMGALESAILEVEFSRGLAKPDNPHLADGNADLLALTPQRPDVALGMLLNAIAETGKMGVIHATPAIANAWSFGHLVERDGATLRVVADGTPVVVGYGYLDDTPEAMGTTQPTGIDGWAYATGPVQIRHDSLVMLPDNVSQALDRSTNVITYRAERNAIVDWDTELQAAVWVNTDA